MSMDGFKVELEFPGMESVGCKQCKSIFHDEANCPQTKTGESKFHFKSRKEMGLEPGALPFKFQVEIDEAADDEAEVVRKRALLRLNSRKVYDLMGVSVKAQEAQKAALGWLIRLADEMDIDDPTLQEERRQLIPLIQTMQGALSKLTAIRQIKVKQAERMEEIATTARRKAVGVRSRIAKREHEKRMQNKDFFVLRLPESNVDIPVISGDIDPLQLVEDAVKAIREKERSIREEPFSGDES
jgi:hypothetical protein